MRCPAGCSCGVQEPNGLDIGVSTGTEVLAVASGTVQTCEDLTITYDPNYSFGKYIKLKHDDETVTLYAHLSEFKFSPNQRVNIGDVIALSESTGNSAGPHLHYEMTGRNIWQYYQDNGYRDPREMNSNPPNVTGINPSLLKANSGTRIYAYTLAPSRYNVYSSSSLTTPLSSTAWTGENDEDYLTGVGKNSSGTAYAQISYPTSSGRNTGYVNLSEVFVPGSLTAEAERAVRRFSYDRLYIRIGVGRNSSYWVDAGDSVYLLTEQNGWAQILYPASVGAWRIAWLTKSEYDYVMGKSGNPHVITSVPNEGLTAGKYYSLQ